MIGILKAIAGFFGGGLLDRALATVDKHIDAQTDRERIKGDIIIAHMNTRAGWLRAGGIWTLLIFACLAAFHFGAVVVYSVFWCADCAFPQPWTIAALPGQMAEWEGWIILASIGGLSLLARR